MTFERENREKLPELRYNIPPEDLKKINELLAPIGWSAGAIFRARRIEVLEQEKALETIRYRLEAQARDAGKLYPGCGYIENDPEYKTALEKHQKLFYED